MASDIVEDALKKTDSISAKNTSENDNPIVWVSDAYFYSAGKGGRSKVEMSLEQMQNKVKSWAAARSPQYNDYARKLIAGGFMDKSYADQGVTASRALAYAVELYQAYSADGGGLSFDDWFDWYASTAQPDTEGGRGGYTGPVTTTTTTITDEVSAEALIDSVARDLLGRSLNPRETQKYLRQFRAAEMEAPQVTTTTPGVATRSTETVTAADKGELLRQIISENPDYQDFQMDTTIMDMLLKDIKAGQEIIYG